MHHEIPDRKPITSLIPHPQDILHTQTGEIGTLAIVEQAWERRYGGREKPGVDFFRK
jgi:hypothetical protein